MTITPTHDGLITIAQAAALTNRSESAVRAWIRDGYSALDGTRTKVRIIRRDGWVILVDHLEIAKAAHATDPRGRFRNCAPIGAVA